MGIKMLPPLYQVVMVPTDQYGPEQNADFTPDAHPETNTVDGYIFRQAAPWTWAGLHDGAGTLSNDTGNSLFCRYTTAGTVNVWNNIYRAIFLFNTGAIAAGSLIVSAYVKIFCDAKGDTLGSNPTYAVVSSSPASNTALVAADYQALGAEALSEVVTYANINVGDWTVFTLVAAGLAKITPGGITKMGMREYAHDCLDVAPAWVSNRYSAINFDSADRITEQPPTLHVVWRPPL